MEDGWNDAGDDEMGDNNNVHRQRQENNGEGQGDDEQGTTSTKTTTRTRRRMARTTMSIRTRTRTKRTANQPDDRHDLAPTTAAASNCSQGGVGSKDMDE